MKRLVKHVAELIAAERMKLDDRREAGSLPKEEDDRRNNYLSHAEYHLCQAVALHYDKPTQMAEALEAFRVLSMEELAD